MLISIVLNVLNEKRHIKDLLDSLVVQEQPIEIVVVDAGSVDGTREIVHEYMKKYDFIKLYIKGGTRGESTNFGIEMAKGKAIAIIGGDCIANAFWIKELRQSLVQAHIVAGKTINIGYHAFADLDRVLQYSFQEKGARRDRWLRPLVHYGRGYRRQFQGGRQGLQHRVQRERNHLSPYPGWFLLVLQAGILERLRTQATYAQTRTLVEQLQPNDHVEAQDEHLVPEPIGGCGDRLPFVQVLRGVQEGHD